MRPLTVVLGDTSGAIFLVVVAIMIAPAAHRLLHRLHLEVKK